MEEKKLTDEEIVKVLEICANWEKPKDCDNCPLANGNCRKNRAEELYLDLIHRLQGENAEQKAEIERLTTRCEIAEGTKNRLTIFDRIEIHDKAVKDTAKEIFTGIKESFVFAYIGASEDYEKGYNDALADYDKQLTDFAKEEYDVEVE